MNQTIFGDCRETMRDLAAQALGRQWIGCELNPDYGPLQHQRTAQGALGF